MADRTAGLAGVDAIDAHRGLFAGRRIGLVANAASVDRELIPTWQRLEAAAGAPPVRLFAPEHGISGIAAPGEALEDGHDPASGLPVVALYGPRDRPEPHHLSDLDVLVFDLPDAGCRAFTYLSTLLRLCVVAAQAGIPLVVLDRPNPVGGEIEGGGVAPGAEAFVAAYDLPLRHGLTLGEIARLYCAEQRLPVPEVVPCAGWRRQAADPAAAWIAPSPNLPTPTSALAYCGTVLIEGTALSEGRGTTRPFTIIGAPGLDGAGLAARLRDRDLPGLRVRPVAFRPTASKHADLDCAGVELHIHDRASYRALPVVLEILAHLRDTQPELIGATEFLDCLAGGARMRDWCASAGAAPADLIAEWSAGHANYRQRIAPHLLYPGSG